MTRTKYPTPPRTPHKQTGGRSVFTPRNLQKIGRLALQGYSAYQSAKKNAKQPLVESTTTQGDKNNISLRRNPTRARAAKRKYRMATRIAKQLTRLRPNRTYGTTHPFVGQVTDANLAGLVTNRDGTTQNTVGSIGMQSITVVPIGTYSKNDTKPFNDLNNIMEISDGDMGADIRQKSKYKILIKSVFFEMMLKNMSTENACYVDVYFWKCKRRSQVDVTDLIPSSDAQVGQDGPTVTDFRNYFVDSYGWTPFQNKDIMKYIRIFKKERYFLSPGAVSQLEMRVRVNRNYIKEQTDATGDSVQVKMAPNISMGLICIAYGAPQSATVNSGNNTITGNHQVRYSINKNIYWQNLSPLGDVAEEEERAILGRV